MTKRFNKLWEDVRPCPPSTKGITSSEAGDLVKKFKRVFGVIKVDFNLSEHFLVDRLNDKRNKPPVSACELEFVLGKFVTKMGKQLLDDVWDIENRKVKARGKNADNIRPHNYEYGITSRSTGVAIILALQPNPKGQYKVRVNLVTIQRKYGFGINQGEHIVVEGFNPDEANIIWVQVD